MPDYKITLSNCNSIDNGQIQLQQNALNIKYGPNGTGKSTIAKALLAHSLDEGAMESLVPFKLRGNVNAPAPSVTGAESVAKVSVFDESYVSQFTFQPDEVVKNSFEIFVNTPEYRQGLQDIETLFESLKTSFSESSTLKTAVAAFSELRDAFPITKGGAISKAGRGIKGLTVAAKLENIPEPLSGYQSFLQGENCAGWITWQAKGKEFLQDAGQCPFCAKEDIDDDNIRRVSAEYDSAAVRNIGALRDVVKRLGGYLEESCRSQIYDLLSAAVELSPEALNFLVAVRGDIDTLLDKLGALEELSFYVLRDVDDVANVVSKLKVDLPLLRNIDSEQTRALVDPINAELDRVATDISAVQRTVGIQKTRVKKIVESNQGHINAFLKSAGYRYSVAIEPRGESYRMLLKHDDLDGYLDSASEHLSYGEKNAFALILFMHQARREMPDLIILDDPVSSFDKTKKFAILHQLFSGGASLRDLTVLLLTHDIEPAIDVVRATANRFIAARPVVHFLRSRGGVLTEKKVERSDIVSFAQICDTNISAVDDPVLKCVYLRRRYDLNGAHGDAYDVLSSLLHVRSEPSRKADDGHLIVLSDAEVASAVAEIKKAIPDFDYKGLLASIVNPADVKKKFDATSVGYEKVQLFRILLQVDGSLKGLDNVLQKFINETFHIENEYVMQLNPREFDTVPEFVIAACEEAATKVEA